jgi:uncharacterized coiled-coil protein SlyX
VIADQSSTLGTHTTKITGLEALTATQGSSITALNTLTTTQGSSITALNTLTGTAASLSLLSLGDNVVGALSTLKSVDGVQDSNIGALQTLTGTHTTKITGLETLTGTQGTSIDALNTLTGTQGTSIDALETLTGTQGTSITALETLTGTQGTSIDALNTLTGTQGTSIDVLNTITGTQGTSIDALNTITGTQGTSIDALETLTGTQGTSITALQTTATSHAASITTLQTTTTAHGDSITDLQLNGGGPSGSWSFGYDNMDFSTDTDNIWDWPSIRDRVNAVPMPRFRTTAFRQTSGENLAVLWRPSNLPGSDAINLIGDSRMVKLDALPSNVTDDSNLGLVGSTIGSCIRASRSGIFEVTFAANVRSIAPATSGHVVAHMLLIPSPLVPAESNELSTESVVAGLSRTAVGVPRGAIAYTTLTTEMNHGSMSTTFTVQLDMNDVLIPPRFSLVPLAENKIDIVPRWAYDTETGATAITGTTLYSDGSFAVNRCTCSIEWKGDGAVAPAEPVDPPV